jgi:hypothetical protein
MARPLTYLRRQFSQALARREKGLTDFRVKRVLAILTDQNLAQRVGLAPPGSSELLFECNLVNEAWTDPRVVQRVKQLHDRGITVEPIEHTHEIAGRTFTRSKIRVQF